MFRAARAARAAKASRAQSRKFSSKPNNGNGESPGISFSTFFSINAILVPGSLVAAAYASSRDPAAAARVKQIPGVGAAVEWTGEMMGFSASSGNSSSTSRIVTEEETIKAAPAKKMVAENVEKKVSEKKEEKKVVKKEAVVEKKEAPVVAKKEDTPKEAASQTPAPVVTMDTFPPAPSQKPVRQEKTAVEQATPVDPAVPPVVIIDYSHLPQVMAESTPHRISDIEIVSNVADELQKQTIALRKELEATILSDLHKLDEHALRTRVTQLAAEFFERTKWEGVRLHQSLRKVEEEIGRKYKDILAQQRAELELEAHKMMLAREQELMNRSAVRTAESLALQEEAFSNALKAQAEGFKQSLTDELTKQKTDMAAQLQDEFNNEVANIRKVAVDERMSLQSKIGELTAHVQGFEAASEKIHGLNEESLNAHKFSAAVLSLQSALQGSRALGAEVAAVKSTGGADPLVQQVVANLPKEALSQGVPSLEELTLRFAVVREEVRKANLAPEGLPAVVSQAIGSAMAKVYWTPSGPVQGDGAEEILSRAAHRLDNRDLQGSLSELKALETDRLSKSLMEDWTGKASARLQCEQAAKALRAQAVIKHSIMASKQ